MQKSLSMRVALAATLSGAIIAGSGGGAAFAVPGAAGAGQAHSVVCVTPEAKERQVKSAREVAEQKRAELAKAEAAYKTAVEVQQQAKLVAEGDARRAQEDLKQAQAKVKDAEAKRDETVKSLEQAQTKAKEAKEKLRAAETKANEARRKFAQSRADAVGAAQELDKAKTAEEGKVAEQKKREAELVAERDKGALVAAETAKVAAGKDASNTEAAVGVASADVQKAEKAVTAAQAVVKDTRRALLKAVEAWQAGDSAEVVQAGATVKKAREAVAAADAQKRLTEAMALCEAPMPAAPQKSETQPKPEDQQPEVGQKVEHKGEVAQQKKAPHEELSFTGASTDGALGVALASILGGLGLVAASRHTARHRRDA